MGEGAGARRFADLGARIASAVVLAGAGLALVWLGGVWTAAGAGLAGAIMAVEFREVALGKGDARGTGKLVAVAGVAGTALASALWWPGAGLAWLAWSLLAVLLAELVQGRGRAALWTGLGVAYVGSAVLGLVYLRMEVAEGLLVVLWIIATVVASDVGAYFAGRLIGGPRLWRRVSPGKTWAGALGGLIAAAAAGAAIALIGGHQAPGQIALFSVGVSILAQAGDLAESAFKRHFDTKDSGSILPGHGGLLDRFDGLLPVTIVLSLMAWAGDGRVAGW